MTKLECQIGRGGDTLRCHGYAPRSATETYNRQTAYECTQFGVLRLRENWSTNAHGTLEGDRGMKAIQTRKSGGTVNVVVAPESILRSTMRQSGSAKYCVDLLTVSITS